MRIGRDNMFKQPRVLPGMYKCSENALHASVWMVVSWNDCCTHSPLSWPQAFSAHLCPSVIRPNCQAHCPCRPDGNSYRCAWQRYASPGQACLILVTELWSLSLEYPPYPFQSHAHLHWPCFLTAQPTGVPFSGPKMLMSVSITWQLWVKEIPRSWVPAGLKPR